MRDKNFGEGSLPIPKIMPRLTEEPAAKIIVLTDEALKTGQRVLKSLPAKTLRCELWVHQKCRSPLDEGTAVFRFERLAEIMPSVWQDASVLIFIMATGIVVRHIAPFLQRKDQDPAVLVLDEKGEYVIPLLSGHLGGANHWANVLAERLQAQAVITTATDVQGMTAPDEYARRFGWTVEPLDRLKKVNRHLLDSGYLKVWSELEFSPDHPLKQDHHYVWVHDKEKEEAEIWITPFDRMSPNSESMDFNRKLRVPVVLPKKSYVFYERNQVFYKKNQDRSNVKDKDAKRLRTTLIPKALSLGIGCRRGVSKDQVLDAVWQGLLQVKGLKQGIIGIFSVDLKEREAGLIDAAQELGVPFKTFTRSEIQTVMKQRGLSSSEFVKEKIGVDGVCEAASLLGTKHGELILPKQKYKGVTVAISLEKFLS